MIALRGSQSQLETVVAEWSDEINGVFCYKQKAAGKMFSPAAFFTQ